MTSKMTPAERAVRRTQAVMESLTLDAAELRAGLQRARMSMVRFSAACECVILDTAEAALAEEGR